MAASLPGTVLMNNAITNALIASNTITSDKISFSATQRLLGSNSLTTTGQDIQLGPGLTISSAGILNVGATAGSIPASSISPNVVTSVNGVSPTNGNVTVLISNVTTGTLASLPPVGPPQINGNIYIVSGDPTPSNNGETFIYSTTPTNAWLQVTPNLATTDARYLQLSGGTMTGPITSQNISVPTGSTITLVDPPATSTSAANKAYVDAKVALVAVSTNTLISSNNSITSTVNGVVATLSPPSGTMNSFLGFGPSNLVNDMSNGFTSVFAGTNPNLTTPTYKPATNNTVYIGNNGSSWIWNGVNYITSLSAGTQITQTVGPMTPVTLGDIVVQMSVNIGPLCGPRLSCVSGLVRNITVSGQSSGNLTPTIAGGNSQSILLYNQNFNIMSFPSPQLFGDGGLQQPGGSASLVIYDYTVLHLYLCWIVVTSTSVPGNSTFTITILQVS